MPFIGNQPALSYTSFAKQDFTTSATTSYTLDNPVTNANELALFINFVRQEPTTAYSASGTSLTLTSATSASDDMYCVFLGKAVQTVNPPNASVGASQIVDASITSGKLASGVLPTNTPAFQTHLSSNQSLSANTEVKIQFDTEDYDTDNDYDNSTNYRFTISEAGKYYFYTNIVLSVSVNERAIAKFKINGTTYGRIETYSNVSGADPNLFTAFSKDFSVNDYVEVFVDAGSSGATARSQAGETIFGGYKLIT